MSVYDIMERPMQTLIISGDFRKDAYGIGLRAVSLRCRFSPSSTYKMRPFWKVLKNIL